MIDDLAVAHAVAGPGLGQQVGGVRHGLHAARNHDPGAPGGEQVVGQHGRLHARAAHLVDRGATDALGEAGAEGRLAGRRLAEACRQYTQPMKTSSTSSPADARLGLGSADRRRTELRRGERAQIALEAAHEAFVRRRR